MQEVFRSIKGYEELYEVSNLGRVKSLHWDRERILKLYKVNGYLYGTLSKNGRIKSVRVARLVALAFIQNPRNLAQVNHKNSIKTDNRVENLEWCDQRYNHNHFNRTQKRSSKYLGVHWAKAYKKWCAQISHCKRKICLGYFINEIKAAKAYEKAREKLGNVA